ncbi:M48 family metallopeptidase [Bacteroides sp.]|uniref:M48 family metallopeptidase n=1 Tax=Bacteroides sp. TaxID=29523 RepID=UPI00261F7E43|nr:SprT family zinc-dependent metalloprotease [Bacteroides sp.]MDD3036954.1 SprT family zinc-dependent metalloprotease [Bacteroides sp.]
MNGEIVYGTISIQYSIKFTKRKTLGIIVTPEGKVLLNAPLGSSQELIESKLLKRARWIVKQQSYFLSFGTHTPPKKYVSGESHYYLGKQYMLKVMNGKPNSAKYKGRYFEVVCSQQYKAEELMRSWYREHAKIKFAEIAEPIITRFAKYGISPSSIYIQEMGNRWGSCTPKGKIILNTELIKAPKPCIEYVITHELCHLLHHDHTKAFFELLESEMPDWKRWKNKLEKFMV